MPAQQFSPADDRIAWVSNAIGRPGNLLVETGG
jgi:hypothetical protein